MDFVGGSVNCMMTFVGGSMSCMMDFVTGCLYIVLMVGLCSQNHHTATLLPPANGPPIPVYSSTHVPLVQYCLDSLLREGLREGVIAHSQGGKGLALRWLSYLLGMLVTSPCLTVPLPCCATHLGILGFTSHLLVYCLDLRRVLLHIFCVTISLQDLGLKGYGTD